MVVCWKCGKEGHFKRDCKLKFPNKGKGSDEAPSLEVKTTSDEGGDVYLASSSTHVDHEAWLIDLGASFYFTPHREWFYEYEKYDGGDVFLGNDRKAKIVGHKKVNLKLQGGRVRTLPSVLHILTLAKNLISISKLDDAVRIGDLYKLQGSIVIDGCNSSMVPESRAENLVVSGEKTMLWHQRFKEFKALVENQTEKKIKVLRKNNGGEFCNKEFEEFCKKCGISRQKTTAYTPQQNGVAEGMNKALMERARSMLSGAGLR
eukprot:PITA_16455